MLEEYIEAHGTAMHRRSDQLQRHDPYDSDRDSVAGTCSNCGEIRLLLVVANAKFRHTDGREVTCLSCLFDRPGLGRIAANFVGSNFYALSVADTMRRVGVGWVDEEVAIMASELIAESLRTDACDES